MTSSFTAEELASSYFGRKRTKSKAPASRIPEAPKEALTSTSQYIVRRAKEQIARKNSETSSSYFPNHDELADLVRNLEEAEGEELSESERKTTVAALVRSRDHYDILTPLIEKDGVSDIVVRAYNDISIQLSNRENIQTDLSFENQASYQAFVEMLLKRCGKACTTNTPVVDIAPDPEIRACVTHESFSPEGSGPMMTLRVSRHRNVSLAELETLELAPCEVLDYIATLVWYGKATLLVAGEVGAGKTTLVKAIAQGMPERDAILVIEDTPEVTLPCRRFVRTLLTREANTEGAGRISPAQAVRTGMRMAMNRLVLGEMRDAEAAEAFIDVCASGHAGMSTIHARSARDALSRLELFLSRAQPGVSGDSLKRQIANAVSLVVHLDLDRRHGRRRVMEVLEVASAAEGVVQYSPMYSFELQGSDCVWKRAGGLSAWKSLLDEHNMAISKTGSEITLDPELLYERYTSQQ